MQISVLGGQRAVSSGSVHGVYARFQCAGSVGGITGSNRCSRCPHPFCPRLHSASPHGDPSCRPAVLRAEPPRRARPDPRHPPRPPPPDLGGELRPHRLPSGLFQPRQAPSVRPVPSVPSGPVPPPPHGAPRAGVTEPHPRGSPPPRSRDGPRRLRGAISAELPRSADRGPPLRPRPGPEQLRASPAPIAGAEPGPPPPPPTSGGTAGPFPRRGEGSSERPPVFGAGGELRWP